MLEFARLSLKERSAKAGSLRIAPPEHRVQALRADYRQMQEMFTESPPSFGEILRTLQGIEAELNGR